MNVGILERKEREKQMRRDTIVRAAEAVFFEKGLRAATLDEVAEKAEVSKGTIYLYFPSKEDLYCALITRGLRLLLTAFREAKPEEVDPGQALDRLGAAYLEFSRRQSYLFRMLSAIESPAITDKVSPSVFTELEEASNSVLGYVATFVQKGIDDGTFRREVSAHEAVVLFWVSLSGILNLKQRSSMFGVTSALNADSIIQAVDFDSLYAKCLTYLLNLLSKQETRPPDGRSTARKRKGALKQSRAVRKK